MKFMGKRTLRDRIKEELKDSEFRKEYEDNDLPVRLAIQIAKLREKRGLSQKDLAHKLGTKQQVISRIESFQQMNLTLGTLQKIAQALHSHLVINFRYQR